jgi:hypothetical protein
MCHVSKSVVQAISKRAARATARMMFEVISTNARFTLSTTTPATGPMIRKGSTSETDGSPRPTGFKD